MKKQLPAFLTGFLAAVLVLSLSLSAFAAITGKTTIEVGPISIKVKGEIFQPTDVNGNPVDVFVYNGTTYAPLRALAEAYGLEVSYDGEAKMAVVEEPVETVEPSVEPVVPGDYSDWSEDLKEEYESFKLMWGVQLPDVGYARADYVGEVPADVFLSTWENNGCMYEAFCRQFVIELCSEAQRESMPMQYYVDNFYCAYAVMYHSGKTHYVFKQRPQ